jgi:hypothetical protein
MKEIARWAYIRFAVVSIFTSEFVACIFNGELLVEVMVRMFLEREFLLLSCL